MQLINHILKEKLTCEVVWSLQVAASEIMEIIKGMACQIVVSD